MTKPFFSKMSFSKIRCPFCHHNEGGHSDENVHLVRFENRCSTKEIVFQNKTQIMIRAEYWRRHVTEVHKTQEDILLTKERF